MTNAIVTFEPQNLQEGLALAEQMAKSALLPDALRGKPADVLIILMTARELGIGPMQALRGMSVIKGKVVMEAALAVAQVVRRREVCEYFRLVESTDQRAVYETKRVGSEPVKMSFTIEQAKAAGLTSKENWRTFAAAMLRARCSMHLARATYPDLLMGIYDPDELSAPIPAPTPVPERDVTPAAPARPTTAAEAKARLVELQAKKAAEQPEDAQVVEAEPEKPTMSGPEVWASIKAAAAQRGVPELDAGRWLKDSRGKTGTRQLVAEDLEAFLAWADDRPAEQGEEIPA